jgi:hypothetical protein
MKKCGSPPVAHDVAVRISRSVGTKYRGVSTYPLSYAAVDFRDEAARVSAQLLREHHLPVDLIDLASVDVSLCLPAPGDPVAKRKQISRLFLINILIPLVLLAIGGSCLFLATNFPGRLPLNANVFFSLGIGFGVAGVFGMLTLMAVQNAIVRKKLREMDTLAIAFEPTDTLKNVGIENPATRTSIKLLIEDRANLFCDSARRLFIMEGLFYRYVIHAQDVVSCTLERTRAYPFLILQYRVADTDVRLTLAISYVTATAELKRKATLSLTKHPLAAVLERTLGFSIPYYLSEFEAAGPGSPPPNP